MWDPVEFEVAQPGVTRYSDIVLFMKERYDEVDR